MRSAGKNSAKGNGVVAAGVVLDAESPGRRTPILWLIVCGALLIAAIAIGTAIMIGNFRDHALASSKRELENAVALLARHFDQQLADAEIPLIDVIDYTRQVGI